MFNSKTVKQLPFDTGRGSPYTGGMEVHFPPDLEAKLNQKAMEQGRDTESLVYEAVERFIDHDEWFVREVEKGLEQIERGNVLEHEEVGARLEKLLAEKQRPK